MVTESGAQGDGNTSFLRAARAGNLEKVLEHLKNNIDINTCNTNGLNALHLASKDGHVHVVSELLKRGAIVDSATKKGNTALHIASLAGQEEVVALLLQSQASVNVQSQNGFTPLYMAAQENHDSVVKLLLANGANQSLATEDGFTPLAVAMQQGHDKVVAVLLESDTRGKVRLPALHIAAKKDDVKAATLLLENEHNPDITSKSGFTPLHIASHYGNQSIANLLIQKGADVNFLAKHNISPLHVAAKWGKTNMVSVLLEKGANIEAKTRDGLTPLHCAARSGHEQVVDMLLERGAPISAKTKNGLAPLHMAAQGEHVDAARILLYHRAPVDEVTVDYLTALHVAAHCGHIRVAKLLLDRNADANARALNGFTPLHIACKKNRIKVVELLLKHGASISATTESGLTPLHVAAFMGCMNIVIYLLQHDASPDVPTVRGETPLHLAARANQTDIIRILLRNGAQVDARAREQQTPLHIASRLGNVDIAMLLLQHGAQVDATTKDMYTALHIAAKEGQDEVAAVLIENGAALESATKKGFTPLHLAAKYGHMKVAQLLLQKDANVDAQGKNGVTPLHVACHYDKQNVALLLLERGASPHAPAKNGHTPLHIAARKNQMDIATTLLEYGANADTESKAGFTPLHLSSQEGHAEISSLLIEHKANCNHTAKNGLTPMHLCAQEDNVNVAEVIHKNGANINMVTKAGYTPLHVAAHFGQSNMVRFLLQKSANVDADTAIGYTPLHQAAQQGHCHIVNLLLEHKANANAQTANGQTPLHIAKRLGYISVLDSLKSITNVDDQDFEPKDQSADKYRVVAPEAMHETFMSDSEEEGGEDNALSDQPYRYLTVDEMKSLGDDSMPFDVTRDERMDSNRMTQSIETAPRQAIEETISPHRAQVHEAMKTSYDGHPYSISEQESTHVGRKLQWKNFLVSFLVDARGGAMRGCRHSGVKMIIPSRSTCQPTRVTCRYVKPQRTMHPPQLMEGEALASRVLELGPVSVKFQGPIVMEVPHFASLRGKEREIIILRSDNGETWREHTLENSEEIIQDVFAECFEPDEITQLNEQSGNHVCRFLTYDFPQYFAVVSRIRQEVHAIGSEGGMVTSTVVPQVQAVFPQGALTKKIKVGLQAQPVDPDLTAKLLGRGVAVSPIVTVEPRRRKFHKAITLSMPAPKAHSQGMINQYSGNTPTLRLLCSITGGASRAQWEDVTGSTPLTFVNECVSFTTTVSARFWLMDCRNISEATKMATDLYREVIHVPFMARFVVFAKRVESNEAKLRVFCMTDDKEDKTLEKQEQFTEVAKSRDVEVLEGKPQYIEMAGNLVPVTKSGEQLQLMFRAFRENRLPFSVRVKDQHADIVGRTLFMKEPKVAKGEPPQTPICILNIILPEIVIPDQIQTIQDKYDTESSKYPNSHYVGDMRIVDLSNLLGKDYIQLAPEIGITQPEINVIVNRYPNSIARQAQDLIRLFKEKPHFDVNILEYALKTIGREDILQKCKPRQDDTDTEKEITAIEYGKSSSIQRIHDREEIKYSAEEKEVEESESDDENQKRTVAERREKIVKRLSIERQIPASSQKKEIVQEITEIKRQSLIDEKKAIHEDEIMLQMSTDNIIKTTSPENIIKMKLNKFEPIETSRADFDKELVFKYKPGTKTNGEDVSSKVFTEIETTVVDKADKITTNEMIRKSLPPKKDSFESKTETVVIETSKIIEKPVETIVKEIEVKTVSVTNVQEVSKSVVVADEEIKEIEKPSKSMTEEEFYKSIEETITRKLSGASVVMDDKTITSSDLPHSRTPPPTPIDTKSEDKAKITPSQDISAFTMNEEEKYESDEDEHETIDHVLISPKESEAKETIKAVNYEKEKEDKPNKPTIIQETTIQQTTTTTTTTTTTAEQIQAPDEEEHEMEIIRKEASILITNVLEESVNIVNDRQQTITETQVESPNQLISKTEKPISESSEITSKSLISSIDPCPSIDENLSQIIKSVKISSTDSQVQPTSISIKEQRIEKKFQKLSSQVDNIDKSVESFDQTFDSIVHDDEISSLHQDFSKISWNESISGTTSTVADIEQSTPDTDILDFPTDTGAESIQPDISEEMPIEMNVIELDSAPPPRPTPRTCLSTGVVETLEEPAETSAPVPLPRKQINLVTPGSEVLLDQFVPKDSDQSFFETEETSMRQDTLSLEREDLSSLNDEVADDLSKTKQRLGFDYDNDDQSLLDTDNLPVEQATIQNGESLGSLHKISFQEDYDHTTTSHSIDSSKMSLTERHVKQDHSFPSEQINESTKESLESTKSSLEPSINASFKRSPSLTGSLTKLDSGESLEDDKSEKCEPQIGFYIGESSTNIIVKSKSPQCDDDVEKSQDFFLKSTTGEEGKDISETTPLKDDESKSESDFSSSAVIRQGSETRNDILEIESESQKPTIESQAIPFDQSILDTEDDSLKYEKDSQRRISDSKEASILDEEVLDARKQLIEDEPEDVHKSKAAKLDLLLEKSELELSEKLCAIPSSIKSTDPIETLKADTVLPDKLLVERTLEEVEMSLDAAKEELIQVVRDGKAIKESPSEFEFKNISHSKLHMEEGDDKHESLIAPTVLDDIQETNDLLEDHEQTEVASKIGESFQDQFSMKSPEPTYQALEKPMSPATNRWSLHEVENSSSSESYYKSISRPGSTDFDTVQTFHTSSEYQTAVDASYCRESTEYISAVGTLESSGKTISSHESMKSLSSEASGILGSIDTSELSETLVASLGDQDIEIDIENEGLDALELDTILQSDPTEFETQQSCMKRSQEMIFSKEEIAAAETTSTEIPTVEPMKQPASSSVVGSLESRDDQFIASSLEESSILSMSSASTVNTVVNNFEDLIGSAGSSSLAGVEMYGSFAGEESMLQFDEHPQSEIDPSEKPLGADEPRRRGHKRHESTSVSTEIVKNLLEEESESKSPEIGDQKLISSSVLGGDEGKGSESESDHDPYESEYSRAFKSPSQRKKKKERKQIDNLEDSQESLVGPLHLATQVIIEDTVTEELESQITAEEERRPSQNMQDYSNIPDITITDEKYPEETDDFPDSTLYKVKTQDELNKVEDTPISRTTESTSYSIDDEQFNQLVQQQYKQKLADLNESPNDFDRAPDSPDSFEMVDQPDISDEFVIIEEVAKEASEFDVEGKSIKISSTKVVKKHDEEVEQILIKSAPAATNLGSQIFRDDLNFEFEESPPSAQSQAEDSAEMAANKKWVEMQLSDHAAQLRYPYELERGVLEDIKEEDAEFEVGSSRISSFKDSFSSTPDYDVLAGRKYFSKAENDNISMSSLQEFESLEQAISLENRRIHTGSTDSSNGSFTRRYTIKNAGGDDISLSSLKEFEGLENACIEAHLIEIKAKEEAALLLSRSDESNKSNNGSGSEGTQNVIVTKTKSMTLQSIPKESVEAILKSKLEECEDVKPANVMETSLDSLEGEMSKNRFGYEVSEHGSADSLEINKSVELVTSSIDSIDISKEVTTKSDVDSLEPTSNRESVDSIEIEQKLQTSAVGVSESEIAIPQSSVSLVERDQDRDHDQEVYTTTTTVTTTQGDGTHLTSMTTTTTTSTTTTTIGIPTNLSRISMDISNDSLNLYVEQTSSSAATNATYCNEGDSLMSDSMTSVASSTLIEDSSGFPTTSQSFGFHSHHTESIYFEDESPPANSKPLDDDSKKAEPKP